MGAGLVALGVATTIPAAAMIFGRRPHRIARDRRLIGARRFPRKGDDGDFAS
jgi:hypothetical protein